MKIANFGCNPYATTKIGFKGQTDSGESRAHRVARKTAEGAAKCVDSLGPCANNGGWSMLGISAGLATACTDSGQAVAGDPTTAAVAGGLMTAAGVGCNYAGQQCEDEQCTENLAEKAFERKPPSYEDGD